MNNEDKKLLLKDLCARLPYDVIVVDHYGFVVLFTWKQMKDFDDGYISKPYLRPMSSMTKEELEEFHNYTNVDPILWLYYSIDWLNAHHFDYRGLIPKGLAIEAPKGMYN